MSSIEKYWHNFDQLIDKLTKEDQCELQIDFEVGSAPEIIITINDQQVFHNTLSENDHLININHIHKNNHNDVNIKVSMINKTNYDTIIDSKGNILSDKFAKIVSLKINKVDLVSDVGFFYGNHLKLFDEKNQLKNFVPGFWHNDTLLINYQRPFQLWYNNRTDKNKLTQNEKESLYTKWEEIIQNLDKLD